MYLFGLICVALLGLLAWFVLWFSIVSALLVRSVVLTCALLLWVSV